MGEHENSKREFHTARSRTPFADEAAHNPLAALRLRICLAHGIKDTADVFTVDETLFNELLRKNLSPTAYLTALEDLEQGKAQEETKLPPTDPDRMKKWLPDAQDE